ncbi:YcgL domain-containing protein [Pseudomarimonas salicorniae]|uniref:YcgL domain-containing protein M0G41_17055 n=1 Tax=Pseudomarimonas salicorniae TaxID=2933270 RepID=A0ABT0GLF2_9GAMM|nr:YcgL domain-containing protein [Lysobacter sp. CAU 1642]MCK7595371.1 YcgL domain-containing protein [Lysobacter sp. CAU 1642]
MRCFVYRSSRREQTYVYLAERDAFDSLPAPLRGALGELGFVLELELGPDRKLAREDPAVVRANLAGQGFHIQFPPRVEVSDGE